MKNYKTDIWKGIPMAEDNRSFLQKLKERRGRNRIIEPIPFTETSIITHPSAFRIWTPGHYLSLPTRTAAVVTSSTGEKMAFAKGGYKDLQVGAYTIQYVDTSDRLFTLPRISATTVDGAEVSMILTISYKVSDPLQLSNITSPLQALFSVCEAAIKNFIITHQHDELIGEPGNTQFITDDKIIEAIYAQIANNQACRAFWVMNINIKERSGNPEISKLRRDRNIQRNQFINRQENLVQQQDIAEGQKKIELINADKERQVLEIRALSEADRSKILENARLLNVDLERLRKHPDMQHEQAMKKIDALEKVLQALVQAQISSGIPRDMNQGGLMNSFIQTLADMQSITQQIPDERSTRVGELGSTIIDLMAKKK
jgi:hypothetical protein